MQDKAITFLKFAGGVLAALVVIGFLLPYAPQVIKDRLPKY